jgi:hypothetical protein
MSYGFSTYVGCPAVQDELNNQFLMNPTEVQDAIGLLRFINDPVNTNGTLQRVISPGGGKYREVQLRYQPRFTDDSSSSSVISCEGGGEYGDTYATYEIDPTVGISRPWTITPADLHARCEEDAAWFAKEVQKHMDKMARDVDAELAAYVVANAGYYIDQEGNKVDSAVTPYPTRTKTSAGVWVDDLIMDTTLGISMIEWNNQMPFLFGDGVPWGYMKAKQAGCCALQGVDLGELSRQNPIVFMRDTALAQALEDYNQFAELGAGAVQMLKYLEYESPALMINDEALKMGTVVDPKTGLQYDYFAKIDCGVWNFQLKLAYKFVTLPTDVYNTNDRLVDTNGIILFDINNS